MFPDDYATACFCSRTCSGANCINASSDIYCTASSCRIGHSCGNRLHQSASLALMWCSKGYGVIATSPIPKAVTIGEYCGRMIVDRELTSELVGQGYVLQFKTQSVSGETIYVDASLSGSLLRFLNHSCVPNCRFEERSNKTSRRMAVVTQRMITRGEEVTVKYSKNVPFLCRCGEATCQSKSKETTI